MMTLNLLVLSIVICLSVISNVINAQGGGGTMKELLFSMPVEIDGIERSLDLFKGQSVEMAAMGFAKHHGLAMMNDETVEQTEDQSKMLTQLSNLLTSRLDTISPLLFQKELTINGNQIVRLEMREGQTMEDVISSFVTTNNIPTENHAELIPQLQNVIESEINAVNQARAKDLAFTLPLNIGGQQFEINHFKNQAPLEEAHAFCQEHQIREDLINDLVPQIAELIQREIENSQNPPAGDASKQQPSTRILFTIKISMNHEVFDLQHLEGYEAIDSALRFLVERGITDETVQQNYLPELVSLIQQQITSNDEGTATSQSENANHDSTPVFTFPIVINQQSIDLHYFEGDVPEESAHSFATRIGLEENPEFPAIVNQISNMIKKELADRSYVPVAKPLFTLPMTLADGNHDVLYYQGEDPDSVSMNFCQANKEFILSADLELSVQVQMDECSNLITKMIVKLLEKNQNKDMEELSPEGEESLPPLNLLFALEVDVNGQAVKLNFYEGNEPIEVAKLFCHQTGIDLSNVEALVSTIQKELSKLPVVEKVQNKDMEESTPEGEESLPPLNPLSHWKSM